MSDTSAPSFRTKVADWLSGFNEPVRFLLIAATCVIVGALLFWLFNQVFYFYVTKSYVDEIADAYDLNRGFTGALLWATFPAVVVLAGLSFSFSKRRRWTGYGGLLVLIIGHSLLIGAASKNFTRGGDAVRCYVLTRNNVKVLNRVRIDPETGLECRPLTPVMQEKIALYQKGDRPTRLTASNPTFFSAISGEPVVWYWKDASGTIELFDLMGYHPQTGEELKPVTRQIVSEWQSQAAKVVKRAPTKIDPNAYAFYDAVSGKPQVWYWRSDADEYEFYDGPGFQPRTGEPLQAITREAIANWRRSVAAAAANKKAEQERAEQEQRAEQARKDQEAKAQAELEQQARQAAAEAERERLQAANDCDRLAANPTDRRRTSEGVSFDMLKGQADSAYDACTRAVQMFPDELRYQYELGRAAQFKDRKQAFDIFTKLVAARYPAAFDNLGGIYLYDRKDVGNAIRLFTTGASLEDADSMVSLADLVDRGLYGQQDPYRTKWTLLNKAAQLNHQGAQRAVTEEKSRMDNTAAQQEQQREAAQNAAAVFGTILGGMRR
ncbi:tetratricopeptide repeat protein [Nitrobacter sp. JJSN]|uniref:tetratricopeptide repeat protein n=1 Tax=Nitrobacter sp. JJSN TaxID=3453033 RepID=UPI003F762CB0